MHGETEPTDPDVGAPARSGEAESVRWVAALYDELRALAQSELAGERPHHTLSATALVNEVYLKFNVQGRVRSSNSEAGDVGGHPAGGQMDRSAFFGAAAQAMRRILVDHARTKKRLKRGGGAAVGGSDALAQAPAEDMCSPSLDPLLLDELLVKLAKEHQDAARVVELRFFAGLTDAMIGEIMQINERTVRRHWTFAKAWLAREMRGERGEGDGSARC